MAVNVGDLEVKLKTSVQGYILHHAFYLIIIAVGLVAGYSWLKEHDQRLLSDQQVKVSEARVQSLQSQIEANSVAAQQTIALLKKQAATVRTVPQAIAAIPDVSNLQLTPRALPDDPTRVSVEALPLYNELNQCRQDAAELGACRKNAELMTEQLGEKQKEIVALKKKPKFWARFKSTAKTVGIGAIIGAVGVGVLLK